MSKENSLSSIEIKLDRPTLLYEKGEHSVYWLGIEHETAFRCNSYLIKDGGEFYVIDPGSREFFPFLKKRVDQIVDPEGVKGVIICHQDPDVAGSLPDWMTLAREATIFSSPRTLVLLPHYGIKDFAFHDIEEKPEILLPSGEKLSFITAPFLHSPMAFVTYDSASRFLFTGDIYAAIEADWELVVTDFDIHQSRMNLFHQDYMASNKAARGFVEKVEQLAIDAILPQHGSIIPGSFVDKALDYLRGLQCGTDLLYPTLE